MSSVALQTIKPLELILSKLNGVKRSGNGYVALCPAHDDKNQSLSVSEGEDGRVLLYCHAGCEPEDIVRALGLTMADLFPPRAKPSKPKLTLEELAKAKGFSVEYLKGLGVVQGINGVQITYKLRDGSLAKQQRTRLSLTTEPRFKWLQGAGAPVPYGLWLLDKMRQRSSALVLVEGESDCWTLWHYSIPALGIPGAKMAKTLEADHVSQFEKIYIYQEPDTGGKTFVTKTSQRLSELNYSGQVFVIHSPDGFKDPNDIHRTKPAEFKTIFEQLIKNAEPLNLAEVNPPPTVQTEIAVTYNLTDLGNARRLVKRHGQDIRYCHPWEKWLVWDGTRWVFDTSGEVHRRAKETVASIYAEASEAADIKEREQIAKHAMRSESDARINAMINLAKSEPGIPILPEQVDADPWLLNLRNGVLDLRTFELRPHRREDLMMKMMPVEYMPDAKCPRWLAFLNRIMDGNQELISYLQRVVGYALTGDTREQCLFLLYGTGANGKSTFLETLKALFGDYGQQADFSTFLHSDQDRVRNDIARLLGKRFVAAIEADAGRRLAEVLVKQLTGGDTVTARFLYREYFEFKPTFKIFLAANMKPTIRGQDYAIWRRIRLIPFTVTIPEPERDKNLALKLKEELPGILSWAVEGCRAWQQQGLAEPPEVLNATQSYREEMDILGGFIDECCVVHRTAQATTKALYAAYLKWCEENAEKPLSKNAFSTRLKERGFEQTRLGKERTRAWLGIGLLDAAQQQELVPEDPEGEDNDEPF